MKKLFTLIMLLCLALSASLAAATDTIRLDGSFDDWSDKPVYGKRGDYRWFYDQQDNHLYLYAENAGDFSVRLKTKGAQFIAEVGTEGDAVSVALYDNGNNLIYTERGSWAAGGSAECSIPLDALLGGSDWGYEVRFKIGGEKWAVLSTASSGFVWYLLLVIPVAVIIPLCVLAAKNKRRANE